MMVYALVQRRTRHLRLRQVELQRTVRERTADLEKLALALQRESAALKESSLTDPLTGLRNRRFLTQHIEADLALTVRKYESHLHYGASLRDDAGLVFFLLDLDHFKYVNDRYGHAAGDAVLKQMSDRLGTVFRETDYLVRWGGEEFLVVARATPHTHAAELAERLRAAVADQPFELDDGSLLARTCSIGFCCFPLSAQHPGALDWSATVNIADAALYARQECRPQWLAGSTQRPWRIGRCPARPVAPTAGRVGALRRDRSGLVSRAQRHGGGPDAERRALRSRGIGATCVLT
jgi:diguanylate cyclase (GGDEF)-like protein